jgi:hypothetical protein
VLDAVVVKLPMALISLAEISDALELPPKETIPLIGRAERERLIDVWEWKERTIYACLSAKEGSSRSLVLTATEKKDVESADWKWRHSEGAAGAGAKGLLGIIRSLARGRGKALVRCLRHYIASDDPIADEDRGLEAVADLPRRHPPLRKSIKWRWKPTMTDVEVRAYLRQFASRPAPRRHFSGTRPYHPPGILLGTSRPGWTRDCERGSPCPICVDRPLSEVEACLGCARTGLDRG